MVVPGPLSIIASLADLPEPIRAIFPFSFTWIIMVRGICDFAVLVVSIQRCDTVNTFF